MTTIARGTTWALLVAVAMIGGCQTTTAPVGPSETAFGMTVYQQLAGDDLNTDDAAMLINSREDLDMLQHEELAGLEVDFDLQSVVVVALGECPTTGWWIRIDSAHVDIDKLYVQGVANEPDETQIVGQTLTYPYAAAVIDRVENVHLIPEFESVQGKAPDVE